MSNRPNETSEANEQLSQHPPSYRRALRDLSWFLIPAAFMFLVLWVIVPNRSIHQDEFTNVRIHGLRERGENAESQHRYFHEFYAWWLTKPLDHRQARIPAMVIASLNLFLFAALCYRLAGFRAAALASILFLVWPRSWDDAQEMRYYGFVYFTAVISFHALLSMLRGATLWPMLVLPALLYGLRYWHPTPLPFQVGMLGIAALILVVQTVRPIICWKQSEEHAFPLREIMLPGALLSGGMTAAGFLVPRILESLNVSSLIESQFKQGLEPRLGDLMTWFFAWVDDRYATEFPLLRIVRAGYVAFLALGAVALARSGKWFLSAGVLLLLGQLAGALFTQGSWERLALGYKYLTSSAVFLMVLLALGMDRGIALVQERWPNHSPAAYAALAVFFFLPILPRTWFSATGDASNFDAIWSEIAKISEEEGAVPIVYGSSDFTMSYPLYRKLLPQGKALLAPEHEVGSAAVKFFVSRDEPVIIVYHSGRLDELHGRENYREVTSWRSNFTPSWDMTLLVPADDQPEAFRQQERRAAYAQRGPLDRWNRPVGAAGGYYWLSNNRSVTYRFQKAEGPSVLAVSVTPDLPAGGAFLVELNGGLILGDVLLENPEGESEVTYRLKLPTQVQDDRFTITITNLGENSARKKENDEVRTLKLTRVGIEPDTGQEVVSSLVQRMPIAESPAGLEEGAFPIRRSTAEKLFRSTAREEGAIVSEYREEGLLFLRLPAKLSTQTMQSPVVPVTPGTLLVPEIEARAINPGRVNFVPFVMFLNEANQVVGRADLSQLPINRNSVDWTRRVSLIPVPPQAAKAFMLLFFNSPAGYEPPGNSGYEIRLVRLTR